MRRQTTKFKGGGPETTWNPAKKKEERQAKKVREANSEAPKQHELVHFYAGQGKTAEEISPLVGLKTKQVKSLMPFRMRNDI